MVEVLASGRSYSWMLTALVSLVLLILAGGIFLYRRNATAHAASSNDKSADAASAATDADAASSSSLLDSSNSVSVADLQHLVRLLRPNSTYWDVLLAIVSAPENVAWSVQNVHRVERTRLQRRQQIQTAAAAAAAAAQKEKESSSSSSRGAVDDAIVSFEDLVNQGGWADDDDDDDDETADSPVHNNNGSSILLLSTKQRALKAAQLEQEKRDRYEAMKQTTREAIVYCEGLDEGVLGQTWVEGTLEQAGVWPPNNVQLLSRGLAHNDGTTIASWDQHAGVRRMLCMTVGRLHSMMLNSHSDLLTAQSCGDKIDGTYFGASMEFRNRVSMYLEATLRIALSVRSARLLQTVIETVTMFKLGVKCGADVAIPAAISPVTGMPLTDKERSIPWFNTLMTRQYGILPRLRILEKTLQPAAAKDSSSDSVEPTPTSTTTTSLPPPSPTLAASQAAEIVLKVERIHAKQFVAVKTQQFQKQQIPPEVGLSTYREGWWFLLRVQQISVADTTNEDSGMAQQPAPISLPWPTDPTDLIPFETEDSAHRLLTAWPMVIHNIAQEKGLIKIQFTTPPQAGLYRYHVGIASQDFFGADQEIALDVQVVEPAGTVPTTDDSTTTTTIPTNAAADDESKKEK
jgi:hypothetical protein